MNWPKTTLLALLLTPPLAVAEQVPPPQFLESHQACLITDTDVIPVQLEQAADALQHRFGLMERTADTLPDDAGMLFIYQVDRGPTAGFWMYKTLIPLDIAWLDDDGVILAMDTMEPCTTESARNCPSWIPGVTHRNVLEMNAGFFEQNNVAIGDKLLMNLNDHMPCHTVD